MRVSDVMSARPIVVTSSSRRETVRRLMEAETVLVWDSGVPAGIVTPGDLRALVREVLRAGVGRRDGTPVVALIRGPAGSGKTTLLTRTLSLLPDVEHVPVFVLAPGHDDRGLREWAEWLRAQVRVRGGDRGRQRTKIALGES